MARLLVWPRRCCRGDAPARLRRGAHAPWGHPSRLAGAVLSRRLPPREQVGRRLVPEALASRAERRVDDALPRAAGVSIMARIVRQFEAPHELVTLEKVIELPALHGLALLQRAEEGVEGLVGYTTAKPLLALPRSGRKEYCPRTGGRNADIHLSAPLHAEGRRVDQGWRKAARRRQGANPEGGG